MKFRSPSSEPLHVALTSGHTVVVPPEGVELASMFQREAMARGAVLADGGTDEVHTQILSRQLTIKEAMIAMIAGASKDDFTADGKPNLVRLKTVTGFQVSREEADAVFDELSNKG